MDMFIYIVRWIIGIPILIFGIITGLSNWADIIETIKTRNSISLLFFLGSIIIIIGALIVPLKAINNLWWMAFLIDFASFPLITLLLIGHFFCKKEIEKKEDIL